MTRRSEIRIHRPPKLMKAETVISYVLRYGVILCASVIAIGLALRIFHLTPTNVPSRKIISELLSGQMSGIDVVPRSVPSVLHGLSQWNADVIMSVGLLLLVSLPVIRVGLTVFIFLIEEDWIYLGITFFVFCVLISGILFGKAL